MKTYNFYILFIFTLIVFDINAQVPTQDSMALVDLYNNTDGPNWTDNTNWLSDQPVNQWYGVSVQNNRVREISLRNNNLSGMLPQSLDALTDLLLIDLASNGITDLPDDLGDLSIEVLNLGGNQLTTFPTAVTKFTNLRTLFLDQNQMTSTLPAAFNNLTNLSRLNLNLNQFSGEFPSIQDLSLLEYFYMTDNQFTGDLSEILPSPGKLFEFYCNENAFSGSINADAFTQEFDPTIGLDGNDISDITELHNINIRELNIRRNQLDFADIIPILENGVFSRYSPPGIIFSPGDQTVAPGSTLTLTCNIEGEGTIYEWQKDNSKIAGATTQTLSINEVTEEDAGSYTCSATNPNVEGLEISQEAIQVTVSNTTSSEEVTINELEIGPNPAFDYLKVKAEDAIDQIIIYHVSGQRIYQQVVGQTEVLIDISFLTPGPYIIATNQGRKMNFSKIIKR